jgi:hypothetical protein
LVPGEFLEIDSSYGVDRGSSSTAPSFAFFSEPGRGDLVTGGKVPILQFGPYEADTSVYLRQVNGSPDAGLLTVGAAVSVTDVQNPATPALDPGNANNLTHRGIKPAADGDFVVGYISRITGTGSNTKIRIMCGIGSNYKA